MMDQALHNEIVSFIRSIGANLASSSHFVPGDHTHSADPREQ